MKLPGIINRITIWRNRRISASQFLLILSLVVGILSGLAAVLLKNIVHYTFYLISKGFQFERENYLYLALPLIGISITVVFTKFILKKTLVMA